MVSTMALECPPLAKWDHACTVGDDEILSTGSVVQFDTMAKEGIAMFDLDPSWCIRSEREREFVWLNSLKLCKHAEEIWI